MGKLKWIAVALVAFMLGARCAKAQVINVNSLAQLRSLSSLDNLSVKLAPGEYWLEGDGSNPTFLEFSGSNSTYDLTGAQIKMDTRELAGYGSGGAVRPIQVTGSSNFIQGMDFSGHDIDLDTDPNARRYSDRSAVYLQVTGDDNHLQDTTLLVRGSSPYGYGDVFGKGARFPESGQPVEEGGFAFLSHNKTSSFLVTGGATNTIVDNLDLTSAAYGHGFFVQGGATNTTIRNSVITGEICQGNDAIAHPEYQEYAAGADGILGTPDDGGTRSGTPLPENIQISCQEDGIRMYTGTTGLTVENTIVTNFRSGVHSTFANGTVVVDGVEAYGTENAFVPGSNTTITNSKADIVNGPAVYVQYNGKSNTTIDIEIVGDQPVGVDWAVAYLNGSNFDVTISSDLPAGHLPEDSLVRFGQTWFNNWRDQLRPTGPETADPGPFTNSNFTNHTNEYMVLGNLATGNTGSSQAPVVTNGKNNAYDGISIVLSGTHVTLTDTQGLGNNGTAADGSLDANASIVEAAATLEIQAGLRIENEKLTITGDGVDGSGALYSDGSNDTNTRFGSTNSSDESTIFLDGNASIGVGVAGNQLIVGSIQGTGDLTKRGAGAVQISKPSTFNGDLIVAEGHVTARPGVVHTNLTVAAGATISGIGNNAFNTSGEAYLDGVLDLNSRTDDNTLSGIIGKLHGTGAVLSSNPFAGTGGVLEIAGNAGSASFSGSISTNISIIKSGESTQTLSGSMTHTGTTSITAGILLVNGTHLGGDTYTVAGGMLGGNGSIDAEITIEAGGTLAPGSSAGQLTVEQLVFETGSSFEIEIGGLLAGTEFDQLLADAVTLAGDISISLLDLGSGIFLPDPTDTFAVLNATSLTGMFDNVASGFRLDTGGGEGSFLVTYDSVSDVVMLSDFALTTSSGDFDADGDVDAADFLTWQRNGLSASELVDWQNSYGGAGSLASAAAVPEPSCFVVSLLVSCIFFGGRHTRSPLKSDTRVASSNFR